MKKNKELTKKDHLKLVSFISLIILIIIGFFIYTELSRQNQLKEEEINMLKGMQIESEQEEIDKVAKQEAIISCQVDVEATYSAKLAVLEQEKQDSLNDFDSTLQLKEKNNELDKLKMDYEQLTQKIEDTTQTICDYSNRAPGENPTDILIVCQNYKAKALTISSNALDLIKEKVSEINTLKANYNQYVNEMYAAEFAEAKADFDKNYILCE